MTEVGLDHVGLILGIEMSRLTRADDDWHRLVQLCGVFRTLLGDQDGLYDPTDHNDRLWLFRFKVQTLAFRDFSSEAT
jgi:hypothetical protein